MHSYEATLYARLKDLAYKLEMKLFVSDKQRQDARAEIKSIVKQLNNYRQIMYGEQPPAPTQDLLKLESAQIKTLVELADELDKYGSVDAANQIDSFLVSLFKK